MERKTQHDFDQELLDLYDSYAHGLIERREFLAKAGKFAVGWPDGCHSFGNFIAELCFGETS